MVYQRLIMTGMLLGQKTRKQLGAKGDGHSSCHGSSASHRGLWGPAAHGTVNNIDQETTVLNDPNTVATVYENMMKFYF